jgi:spore maturation protein CgeB
MNFALFYHSLLSDWNHGNAHFLRGIVAELLARGHGVSVYEPEDGWSLQQLIQEHGEAPLTQFRAAYPGLDSTRYDLNSFDLVAALQGADVVLVHEWNDPRLIQRLGDLRAASGRFRLFFHDTHHRVVTDQAKMQALHLDQYDGVLAYGRVLRDLYHHSGRVARAWIWHEAADTRVFRPVTTAPAEGDMVWIGNWGDEERSEELREFLIEPIQALGLTATVYGVRYPAQAQQELAAAGIKYRGWLPNFEVPRVFGRYKLTVHVPRRPYVKDLPGIPTIRVFEALACGIPLICSPWEDAEDLFRPGLDYLTATTGKEMRRLLQRLLNDPGERRTLARHGLATIQSRHTCAHRVDELFEIVAQARMD